MASDSQDSSYARQCASDRLGETTRTLSFQSGSGYAESGKAVPRRSLQWGADALRLPIRRPRAPAAVNPLHA
ncbi:hypothetical protein SVAN01_11482 [Stagonosporopsis vannaccii]|nr:hypothetical protein SVAN01_11482 [Stagonosporopsis vannaccii]